MLLLAEAVYLLEEHLSLYLDWEVGVFLNAERDLHGLVLEIEAGDVSSE